MGITVREMLESEFFKDFEIITGHKGLDKQIQGIAILDSPDGFKWTKGREFVISSGYVFKENPKLFKEYLESEMIKEISGMGIKVDRYLKQIPKYVLDEFNERKIPLLKIPLEPSWMDIMNGLNVAIMNKNIKQFKISNINPKSFSDKSYHTRKINKILSQIEGEMNFPTMLYDLSNDKPYFSSSKFVKLADGLELKDFWNPSFDYTKELLFGFSDIAGSISEIKRNYNRAEQTIRIGEILYPEENYFTYSKLGVFVWIDIKEDEKKVMLEDVELLIENDENKELVKTLEVYLESNMNYSLTAKKLYIHINTVRKRMDTIGSLLGFDLQDPMNRLNLEILLKLIPK